MISGPIRCDDLSALIVVLFDVKIDEIRRLKNKSNRVRTTDAFWRSARILVLSLNCLFNGIVSFF